MKIAVIGCGTMGRTHGAEWIRMPGIELVGVCDMQEEAARALAGRLETKAFSDFDQMVSETCPEVLDICLPTHMHKEFVIRAARLGKHIICEKPFALSLEEADEMTAVCEQQGVRLFIGHVVRFFLSYTDIRRKAADGVVGKPGVLHTRRMGGNPGVAKTWYNNSEISGGVILDLMIHDIDFAQSIFGKAVSVYAMNHRHEGLDYALATLRFENGGIAHLEGYWGFPGPFTTSVELAGSGGVIRFNSEEAVSLKMFKVNNDLPETPALPLPKSPSMYNPYYLELAHFVECLQTGAEPDITIADARSALQTGLAAIESAATGRPVRIQ
ncbi:Myo-inositol 2-dehydrogenase [Paenibacillus allorhizoplanae]|uniref:Myo-inositol 2-dehydrogenase n=1 Tax=Paenibacillus allorhizoplanae TaxID=2905648 RepID=A0ABN8H103_9BACL|nr:Gfo/Idh/MocA family oxidoreductase [Paenibacillus allorhizoplanae]CAH1217729.1 Myo-inositol 2-dehydrogenase [Paenibacillus allorhizoplanae]